jgi:hypothetical protein
MDYKFLDKVVEQIVSETRIDYVKERVNVPFLLPFPYTFSLPFTLFLSSSRFPFFEHCESVYGLNYDETEYVWKEYREIIKDKIENNG